MISDYSGCSLHPGAKHYRKAIQPRRFGQTENWDRAKRGEHLDGGVGVFVKPRARQLRIPHKNLRSPTVLAFAQAAQRALCERHLIETTTGIRVLNCICRRERTIRIVFRVAQAYGDGLEPVGGIQGRCRHACDLGQRGLAREGGGSVIRNRRAGAVIEPGVELRKSDEDAAIVDPGEAVEGEQSAPPRIMRGKHVAGVHRPHGDAEVAVALRLQLRITLDPADHCHALKRNLIRRT